MYSQLGDIQFEKLFGPSTELRSFGKKFAIHPKINGRDRLQSTGIELEDIELTIKLHVQFCNPQEVIDKIKNYTQDGKVLKYILGTGDVIGNYVIVSGKTNLKKQFKDGTLLSAELDLSLKEYYIKEKVKSAAEKARASAFAINVAQPRPINFTPNIEENLSLAAMQDVQEMNSSVSVATQMMSSVRDVVDFSETASGRVTEAMDKGQVAVAKLQNRISESQALADIVTQLPTRLDNLNTSYQNLLNLMPISPTPSGLADFYQATVETQNAMSFVNYASSPLAAIAGYRGTIPNI